MRVSRLLETMLRGYFAPERRGAATRRSAATAAVEILEARQLLVAEIVPVGDLNVAPETGGSDPNQLTQVGTTLYFTAVDKTHGRELWKKEGSNPAVLVKDIRPGIESSGVNYLTAVGNTLFFQADDGLHGPELWKSDGTAAGTVWVKDIVDPGNPNTTNLALGPKELHAVNGKLFFQAYPEFGNPNPTLMVSDGTAAGTRMVTDTFLNTPLHYDISAAPFGTKFLFDAYGLYITDGTSAGTTQLVAGIPTEITVVGSTAFFALDNGGGSGKELWKTDGTVAGTVLVKDIYPGGTGSFPLNLFNMNGTLYFSAAEPTSGVQLWKSDGTAAGTVLVKEIYPGATNNSSPGNFAAIGNTLYFTANDGITGHDIWKSDGTTAGTVRVGHSGSTFIFPPSALTNVGGTLYFTVHTNEVGLELWKSDGTLAGTSVYSDINPGSAWSNVANLMNINDVLYYTATDGVKGNELWRHDVATNTAVIEDVYRGTRSSNAHNFVTAGNNVYFVTTHMLNGAVEREELWKCALNGTGKTLLRTVQPALLGNTWGFQSLTSFKGELYFSAFDSAMGTELWKSDGTVAGTIRLKDINPTGESWPSSLTVAGDTLYFSALDSSGRELWKTDGTAAGTLMVKDIAAGAGSAIDQNVPPFTAIGSTLYFIASDGSHGFELWKSDGTAAGTLLVKDVNPGTSSAVAHLPNFGFPVQMISIGNLVYFVADDGTNGFELWQSDGTSAGTSLVADIHAGSASTYIQSLTNANGKLYFEYGSIPHGSPLGRVLACRPTATSPLTTIPLLDQGHFRNGTSESLTALGSDVYFTDADGELGTELWKSDGTVAGTVMVKDIFAYPKSTLNAQTYSSDPKQIVAANGKVYFSAYTPANGRELWMSDGTAAGTKLLADLTGDSGGSDPERLVTVGPMIYLTAVRESIGREVFAVVNQPEGTAGNDTFVLTYDGTNTSGNATLTISSDGGPVRNLGTFPMSVLLRIDGLGGDDKITVKGTGGNDTITANASGLNVNGAGLQLKNIQTRILAGMAGDDRYRFDTDTSLGVYTLNESSGGVDTLDFASTTTFSINISLGVSLNQFVNPNLILGLSSATAFENVIGGAQNDILRGNSLANVITGGSGYDNMTGGTGDDTYVFSATTAFEEDVLFEYADQGTDALTFSSLTSQVTLSLGSSSVQASHVNRTIKLNATNTFENLTGGMGHDVLSGNSRNNLLAGGPGNDTLSGQAGSDILAGGTGDDTYVFSAASALEVDSVSELTGQGTDTLSFGSMTTAISLNLGTSAEQQVHTNRRLKLSSSTTFENAVGGSANDTLFGNSVNNLLSGGSGHDIVVGSSGNDTLQGGAGRDLLIGGLGLDTLDGGTDDDILIAGRTTRDNSAVDLGIIRGAWTSAQAYATRVANLRTGVSSPLVSLKAKLNVLNDAGEDDILTGGSGTDWYLKALDDTITDLFGVELTDVL